jgi:hypothetical protein
LGASNAHSFRQQARGLIWIKALDAAELDKWTVVSMKDDWKRIFPFS